MRTRFIIPGSPSTISFKFGQICLINDIVMTFKWSGYSLQTRYKMMTRFAITSSTCSIAFKLCQICWGNKRILSVTSSYLSGKFGTICRTSSKWGPELISQVPHTPLPSNFFRYIGMTIEFYQWHLNGGHTWLWYNLQTIYKMRARCSISGSTYIVAFKLCQISWDKIISLIM